MHVGPPPFKVGLTMGPSAKVCSFVHRLQMYVTDNASVADL
jgi:hypothetical protein